MTPRITDVDVAVERIVERLGRRLVVGAPLGIGKPNALLDALYRRACADPGLQLELITALSLNPPQGKSELERRFLEPIVARVWGDYPRMQWLDDAQAGRLPANVSVSEFYVQAGSRLGQPLAQQRYISSNYTHVARDMLARGVNLVVQSLAERQGRLSLSSNPDVTLQLRPMLHSLTRPWMAVGQINRRMPWVGGAAEVPNDDYHLIVDARALDHEPFAVPHQPVTVADWAIGLHASRLVRDGGTLQVGIGALGDAVCHALRLRQRDNAGYRALLDALGATGEATDAIGGDAPFAQGLYVASELISWPLFQLFEDGIVRRRVYEDLPTQRAVDGAEPAGGWPAGGSALQGAFFIGPAAFYQRLRELPDERLALLDMTSVGEVNRITTHYALEQLQRRHARFINITMKVTLLGAAVSDQLADGQVVSGVGGQYNFVAMAHQLHEGRSILLAKAARAGASNIVWEYPHTTIPRHLRDIVVTEYGVADLRGRTDAECIAAMLAVSDARHQPDLMAQAQRAGKLPKDFQLRPEWRRNTPQRLHEALGNARRAGTLPDLPFGSDFRPEEFRLLRRLKALQRASGSWPGRLRLARALLAPADDADVEAALQHLRLARPADRRERLLARLVRAAYALPG